MKNILYLIHVPLFVVGVVFGTIYAGVAAGFITALDFWKKG